MYHDWYLQKYQGLFNTQEHTNSQDNTQKHMSDGDFQYWVHIPFTHDPFHKVDSPTQFVLIGSILTEKFKALKVLQFQY